MTTPDCKLIDDIHPPGKYFGPTNLRLSSFKEVSFCLSNSCAEICLYCIAEHTSACDLSKQYNDCHVRICRLKEQSKHIREFFALDERLGVLSAIESSDSVPIEVILYFNNSCFRRYEKFFRVVVTNDKTKPTMSLETERLSEPDLEKRHLLICNFGLRASYNFPN